MTAPATPARPPSFGQLVRSLPEWLRHHLPATIVSVAVGGLISYVINVWLMVVRYDGWQKVPPGSPATGRGNLIGGALFWALLPGLIVAVISYWKAVGTRRFFHEMRSLPSTVAGLVRRDGQGARVHLLWGAAVSLLVAQVVSPSVGAVTALGLVAFTTGPLGSILTSGISRLAQLIVGRVAPEAKLRPVGTLGVAVGVLGSSAALVVAYFVSSRTWKWLLAAAAVAGAVALGRMAAGKSPGAGTAAALVLMAAGGAVLADVLHPLLASANDGGQSECGIKIYQFSQWFSQCGGSHAVLASALGGGIAGAVGAPIGAFLGSIAGALPTDWGPVIDEGGPLGPEGPGPGPVVPDAFGTGGVRVIVSGNTVILVGPNGMSISAPLHPDGTAGPWAFAGMRPVGPAPATDATPAAEPSVLDPEATAPPDWSEIEELYNELFGQDGAEPGDDGTGSDEGPPSAPTGPKIDMGAVANALNGIDAQFTQFGNVYGSELYNQFAALMQHMQAGTFDPSDLSALASLQQQMGVAETIDTNRVLSERQQFADDGLAAMQSRLQAEAQAEAAQQALAAQISKTESYLTSHIDDLPAGQYEAAQRILSRIEGNDSPDPETLAQLRQLTGAVFNLQQGASMAQSAQAAVDAAAAQLGMNVASNVQTAATLAETAILFPFVVPGAAAAGAELGAFYLGRNFVQGFGVGYAEGGLPQALINGAKATLPINLINAIAQGQSAGNILLATVQDIGNVAQLSAAAEALQNMRPITIGGEPPPPPPLTEPVAHNAVTPDDVNWLQARNQGQANVKEFQELQQQAQALEAAGSTEAAAATRAQIQDLTYNMNGQYQSKLALKNSPLEVQQAFNQELEPALRQAQAGTVDGLNAMGVERGGRPVGSQDLMDLRNAQSAGTVGMDRDLALNQMAQRQLQAQLESLPPGAPNRAEIENALDALRQGDLTISPDTHPVLTSLQEQGALVKGDTLSGGSWTVNGQPASADQVRDMAQNAYNNAYAQATATASTPGGRSAVDAMQTVTDATHGEAYHDLTVLKNDPANSPFSSAWADQTGSVTSIKGYEATSPTGPFANDPYNAFQEVARGTSKDINSKLLPLLQTNNAPPTFIAQVQDMNSFLTDVKNGMYTPSQAQAMCQSRFGTDIQGLANRVDSSISATVKFGAPPPTGWEAMGPSGLAASATGTAAQGTSNIVGAPPTQIQDPGT